MERAMKFWKTRRSPFSSNAGPERIEEVFPPLSTDRLQPRAIILLYIRERTCVCETFEADRGPVTRFLLPSTHPLASRSTKILRYDSLHPDISLSGHKIIGRAPFTMASSIRSASGIWRPVSLRIIIAANYTSRLNAMRKRRWRCFILSWNTFCLTTLNK